MALIDLLSPDARSAADRLGADFTRAQPFPHFTFDGLLDDAYFRRLQQEFPPFDPANALNDFGKPGGKAVCSRPAQIGPAYAELDSLFQDRQFLSWMGRATAMEDLLYDPDYYGGGTHENLSGESLDPHVDFNIHPRTRWHRRLNLILFLNDEWSADWGGSLRLQRDPWGPVAEDQIVEITPQANRCAVFETSERSWHGFPRITIPDSHTDRTRRTIAVYFYSHDRPAHEVVPEHGTYYVPPPLPERYQHDEELRSLIEARDHRLRHHWERERELRETLHKIDRSVSVRVARILTWPARKIRSVFSL